MIFNDVQYMIRKATFDDIELIEDTYNEQFKHEMEHGALTMFKKGIQLEKTQKLNATANFDIWFMLVYSIAVIAISSIICRKEWKKDIDNFLFVYSENKGCLQRITIKICGKSC